MSGAKQRATRDTVLEDAMRRIRILERVIPSALKWAYSGIGGPFDAASGVTTAMGIDEGSIFTNDDVTFTIDENPGAGLWGLGIHTPGSYLFQGTISAQDKLASPVANPDTFVVEAADADGGGQEIVMGGTLGSNFNEGYVHGSHSYWDVGWWHPFIIDSSGTNVGAPIQFSVTQVTGETLDVYTQMFCLKLSSDTFGLSV